VGEGQRINGPRSAFRLLEGVGLKTTEVSIRRFFKRHKITFKKTLHAAEQARPDVAEARARWKASQASLASEEARLFC
jgi:outer membrane protein TolC